MKDINSHPCLYQTTNNLNGNIYIGVTNKVSNIYDRGYIGSGVRITRAIKKHKKENFTCKILEVCENEEEAYKLERLYVNEGFVARKDTYNVKLGGDGGWDLVNSDPESRIRMVETTRANGSYEKRTAINRANGVYENMPCHSSDSIAKSIKTKQDRGVFDIQDRSYLYTLEAITKRVKTRRDRGDFENMPMHSPESVLKMVKTKKANGDYDNRMSQCHTQEVIDKRRARGDYENMACNSPEVIEKKKANGVYERIIEYKRLRGDFENMPWHKKEKCDWCGNVANTGVLKQYHNDRCKQNPSSKGYTKKVKYKCDWCDVFMDAGNLKQYHNDRCKQNPNSLGYVKVSKKKCDWCDMVTIPSNLDRHMKVCKSNLNNLGV